jgi:hypothetical protein
MFAMHSLNNARRSAWYRASFCAAISAALGPLATVVVGFWRAVVVGDSTGIDTAGATVVDVAVTARVDEVDDGPSNAGSWETPEPPTHATTTNAQSPIAATRNNLETPCIFFRLCNSNYCSYKNSVLARKRGTRTVNGHVLLIRQINY